jgi:hypothetical protein
VTSTELQPTVDKGPPPDRAAAQVTKPQSAGAADERSRQSARASRETAAALRAAADQAPAEQKACYLQWAEYNETLARSLEGGPVGSGSLPGCQLGAPSESTGPSGGATGRSWEQQRAEQQKIFDRAVQEAQDAQRQLSVLTGTVGRSGDATTQAAEEERLQARLRVSQVMADQARKRLQELDRDSAAVPQPAPADYAIPSLRANVVALRFYESGAEAVPIGSRQYDSVFSAPQARFIAFQLDLEHPPPGTVQDFPIVCLYSWPDGTSSAVEVEGHIEPDWTGSSHSGGKGWAQSGHWKQGEYQVSCSVEGRPLVARAFVMR